MKKLESFYRREGETYLIEIKLHELNQLFNSFDPSPFLERELDGNAREYIVTAAGEFSLSTPLKLVFYLPPDERSDAEKNLPPALYNFFNYCQQVEQRQLRAVFKQGRLALTFGLVSLFVCLTLSDIVSKLGESSFIHFIEEGLIIIGWVSLWKPAEIFLFEWWPVRSKLRVYKKLARIPIEIRTLEEDRDP